MRLLASATALLLAGAATVAVGWHDLRQPEPLPEVLPPEGCEKPGPGVPPADDDDQGTGGGGGDLPVTGAPGPVLVAIAGVLLVAGVGGVVLARRRRTRFVA